MVVLPATGTVSHKIVHIILQDSSIFTPCAYTRGKVIGLYVCCCRQRHKNEPDLEIYASVRDVTTTNP